MFKIKTHAILVNTSSLPIRTNDINKLINCLYQYIDIILQPYNDIGIFAYKEINITTPPIIGYISPVNFIESLKYYTNKIYEECSNILLSKELTLHLSSKFQSRDVKELKIMQLISGAYLYDSCFYNCCTKSSLITEDEWVQITNNIEDYALVFMNLYK